MLGSGEDQCPGLGLILHKPTETFDPFAPINMATSSDASNASSMMGESSLPFDEDVVPTIQPMPDPNALQDISLPGNILPDFNLHTYQYRILLLIVGFQWTAQFQQNLGIDFGSEQTPSFSTFFHMDVDAANQQTHQQHQHDPATHVQVPASLASDTNNNHQAILPLPLQPNQIDRLCSRSPSDQTDSVNKPKLYVRPNLLSVTWHFADHL